MDFKDGRFIDDEEFDVYVPEAKTSVKALKSDSPYAIRQKAYMKVNGGHKPNTSFGVNPFASKADVALALHYEEPSPDVLGYAKDIALAPIKGTAQFGASALSTLEQGFAGIDVLSSEAIRYADLGISSFLAQFSDEAQERVIELTDPDFEEALREVQSERMKQSEIYSKKMSDAIGLPEGLPRDIISGSGSVGTSLLLSTAGGPLATAGFYGLSSAGSQFVELNEAGEGLALPRSLMGGAISGWANTIGDKAIINSIVGRTAEKIGLKSLGKAVLKGGSGEFIEEGVEALAENINLQEARELTWQDVAVDSLYQAVVGGIVGAFLGGAGNVAYTKFAPLTENIVEERLVEAGLSEAEAKIMAHDIATATTSEKMKQTLLEVLSDDANPIKYRDGSMEADIDYTIKQIPSQLEGVLLQAEVDVLPRPTIQNPDIEPISLPETITLSGIEFKTEETPHLAGLLFQMAQEGEKVETLADAINAVSKRLDIEGNQKMAYELDKAKQNIYSKLQERFGKEYADTASEVAKANIYAGARMLGISPSEYLQKFFPSVKEDANLDEFIGYFKQDETAFDLALSRAEVSDNETRIKLGDKKGTIISVTKRQKGTDAGKWQINYQDNEATFGFLGENDSGLLELGGFGNKKTTKAKTFGTREEAIKGARDFFIKKSEEGFYQNEWQRLDDIYPEYTGETININGVERPVYNSEGKRIAKSKEALINFYKWFGDSKVVDEYGRPLVVYHGTDERFDVFDREKIKNTALGEGFYFGSKSLAEGYTKTGNVMPVYLKIENPINSTDESNLISEEVFEKIADSFSELFIESQDGYDSFFDNVKYTKTILEKHNTRENIDFILDFSQYSEKDVSTSDVQRTINNIIKETTGIDGYKVGDVWVAFNPNQIKSVDNRGTFSLEEDNIYWQRAFYGSRVDHDKPSLEAIGSGAGVQVHGWGMYYALNRGVAEGYRYKLIDKEASQIGIVASDFYLDKKNYFMKDNKFYVSDYVGKNIEKSNELSREEYREKYQEAVRIDEEARERDEKKGQVHEVDIPENPYLIDEQEMLIDQSAFVQEKIEQANKELDLGIEDSGIRGDRIYQKISDKLGSDKAASQYLEKLGVKGITYENREDGRCFVIFNPDDVKVIQKFYQKQGGFARGAFDPVSNTIYLFEKANRSTFMHEMAHNFLNVVYEGSMRGVGSAVEMKKNIDEWFGHKGGAYTKEEQERFARGFEQFLLEGKAPNNKLKKAFSAFKRWLINIYKSVRGIGLDLSDDIRQVYSEMLGGRDYDKIFESNQTLKTLEENIGAIEEKARQIAEARTNYAKEVAEDLVNSKEAQSKVRNAFSNYIKQKKESAGLVREALVAGFTPLSTRAKEISPVLMLRMRDMMRRQGQFINKKMAKISPLLDGVNKMSDADKIRFDSYMKNGVQSGIEELCKKHGLTEQYQSYREAMDEIYDEASNVGIKINYREVYAPRKIKDKQAFLEFIRNSNAGLISQMDAEIGAGASIDEQAEWLDNHLFTWNLSDPMTATPANAKERTIDVIDKEIDGFYYFTTEAIASYVDGMAQAIVMREVFGATSDADGTNEGLNKSIGEIIAHLREEGKITTNKQAEEVRKIMNSLLMNHGVQSKILSRIKSGSMATLLTRFTQTLSQLADIGTSIKQSGFSSTLRGFLGNDITMEDIGLEKLTEEYRKKDGLHKQLDFLFKISGFNAMDKFGKSTYLNGRWDYFQKMAKNNPEKLRDYLEPMFEDRTDALFNDIKNGRVSEDVKLLMFSEISDIQPTTLAEMPSGYVNNPNGRILYMLKTFTLRRLDFVLNQTYRMAKSGKKAQAFKNLASIALWMGGFEALVALLKDFLRGRELSITDNMLDAMMGIFMINRYQMYKAREEGWSGFASTLIPPMFPMADAIGSDATKIIKGKIEPKDLKVWSYMPLIGDAYYWWFGGGLEKNKKKRKNR